MQGKPQSLLAKVKHALDEEDVEGLLAMGCPRDEYDEEARLIAESVRTNELQEGALDLSDVLRIVEDVCNTRFGPFEGIDLERRRATWLAVAKKIVS
jgi:hypothetical protein